MLKPQRYVHVTNAGTKYELDFAARLLLKNGYRPMWLKDMGYEMYSLCRLVECDDPPEIIELPSKHMKFSELGPMKRY